MAFRNRTDAGQQLAQRLLAYAGRHDVIVLALPRGGVPVAAPVAELLNAPLDVFIVRKLGVPGHVEMAMGAIASGNVRVLLPQVIAQFNIAQSQLEAVTEQERAELQRREHLYRGDTVLPDLRGQAVILVDDGLATGASMYAAVHALRSHQPAQVVVAVPVAAVDTCAALRTEVDDVICVITPEPFRAVGLWYEDFDQTRDDEVRALLARARLRRQQD